MKKAALVLICLALLAGLTLFSADAMAYSFSPFGLYNLNHWCAYTWGIRWTPSPGEYITSAELVIKHLYNWAPDTNDHLYVRLLDDTPKGIRYHWDWSVSSDYFSGQGVPLFTYTDPDDNASAENVTHTFTAAEIAALNNYANNGNFGFGFDPDCHYKDWGMKFTVHTGVVPEPATIALLGFSLLGLFGVKFRASQNS